MGKGGGGAGRNSEIARIDKRRDSLVARVQTLSKKKESLYGNVDIESPMTAAEKQLTQQIAELWSKVNQLTIRKREIVRKG